MGILEKEKEDGRSSNESISNRIQKGEFPEHIVGCFIQKFQCCVENQIHSTHFMRRIIAYWLINFYFVLRKINNEHFSNSNIKNLKVEDFISTIES